ncbi:fibronectin type III domain-containing protein [Puniceicoccaceae bacterium K14]|nr:fibronectin type III domain-containing protein [Puniceicoccaceae bacterium K14]
MKISSISPFAILKAQLLLIAAILTLSLHADVGDPDDALTYFGPRPIYTNGTKPSVVVDDFGWIDDTLSEVRKDQIANAIEEWNANGIEYAAYYAIGVIESEEGAELVGEAGKSVDLDGSTGSWFVFTRSAFTDYLVDSGKVAVDLGASYFLLDNASPGLGTLSFDSEALAGFRDFLSANYTVDELVGMGVSDATTFDYADFLKSASGGSYTDSDSVSSSPPYGDLWDAWLDHMTEVERAFFEEWTSEIRTYANSEYSMDVYFAANRYVGARQWDNLDNLDVGMAETFLDALGYPYYNLDHVYKNIRNFDKRFWSWNFPANTGSMNGSNDPYGKLHITELSKVYAAEVFAAGGLYQIPIDWVSYYHEDARLDPMVPFLQFPSMFPELFNQNEDGEVAVLYNEAHQIEDTGTFTSSYLGAMMLLGDLHRPLDVLFAGHPDKRDGVDPFSSADLSSYKAIVLPQAKMLTDAQVSKLDSYLSGGGIVIGLGDVADSDEYGTDVSSVRSFDDYFSTTGTTSVGSGKVIHFATDLGDQYHGNSATSASEGEWELTAQNETDLSTIRSTWTSAVDAELSYDFTSDHSRFVRAHRYEGSDGSEIYHLVNRDINLTEDVDNQTIDATASVSCSVVIPDGFTSGDVKLSWMIVGSSAVTDISFTVDGSYLDFTLPSFDVWGVLQVGTAATAAVALDYLPHSNFELISETGGNRPDHLDSNGEIAFNYWYWKGGNHGSVPWDIPFTATDDSEVDSVSLSYRYSLDNEIWGDWTDDAVKDVSGTNVQDVISFDAPEGQGYYQFRLQATDDAAQNEILVDRDEVGYGVDEESPGEPSGATEATYETGTWISDPSNLSFSWTLPEDNLSGIGSAYVSVVDDFSTLTDATLDVAATSWSPTLSGLTEGERYRFNYRVEDLAGNNASTVELFSFYYGTLPIADLDGFSVEEGDASLTVSWTASSDPDYDSAVLYVREVDDVFGNWTHIGQTGSAQTTSYNLPQLTNGTAYRIRINAVTTDGDMGNDVVIPGTYTPEASSGSGGSGGSSSVSAPSSLTAVDNTGNVGLEWTDNASDETGYEVEYRASGTENWDIVASIGANSQAFVHNINIGNDSYEYRVKAVKNENSSDYSNVASISRSGNGNGGGSGGGSSTELIAPASLSANDVDGKVQLSWDDLSSDEDGFEIEQRPEGSDFWNYVGSIGANVESFEHDFDIGIDTYEYRVVAVRGQDVSNPSNVAAVSGSNGNGGGSGGGGSNTELIAPASLSANDVDGKVQLSWDDLSSDEDGFEIEQRPEGSDFWNYVGSTGANVESFEHDFDIGIDTYEYRVVSVRGEDVSNPSNVASVSGSSGNGGGGSEEVVAPGSLTAEDISGKVQLSWDDLSEDEDSFGIEYRNASGGDWSFVEGVISNIESFEHDFDIGNETYEYRVFAIRGNYFSDFSNIASVTRSGGGGGQVITYNLSGSVSPENSGTTTGVGTYDQDQSAQVEAIPAEGYEFSHWSGALSGSVNPASVIMDIDKSVVANFIVVEQAPVPVPTEPELVEANARDLTFSWTVSDSEINEFIIQKVNPSGVLEEWDTVVGALEYTDESLTPGSSYEYLVLAVDGERVSDPSPSAIFETLTYDGYYIGEFTGNSGSFAVVVSLDGLADFLIYLEEGAQAIFEQGIELNSDGSFSFEVNGHLFAGSVPLFPAVSTSSSVLSSEGQDLLITVDGSATTGTATKEPSSNVHSNSAGYYEGEFGSVYTSGVVRMVKAPSGKVFAVSETENGEAEPGLGDIQETGELVVTFDDGGELNAIFEEEDKLLSGTLVTRDQEELGFAAATEDSDVASDRLVNISTRGPAGQGTGVMIGGFVIDGEGPKKILINGKGPSLEAAGISNFLADPKLTLFQMLPEGGVGLTVVSTNWIEEENSSQITDTGYAPGDDREPSMLLMLDPGIYTVVVDSEIVASETGVSLVEVYEIAGEVAGVISKVVNISTRGLIGSGQDVMIAGFVIDGEEAKTVLVNAKGPSLEAAGVANYLPDPKVDLYRMGEEAELVESSSSWNESANAQSISGSGFAPSNDLEASIFANLSPGVYTAIVSSELILAEGDQRVALVEVYEIEDDE